MVLFIFGIIFGVAALIAALVAIFTSVPDAKVSRRDHDESVAFKVGAVIVLLLCGAACIGMILGSTMQSIGTGKIGVVTTFGHVENRLMYSGLRFKAPWNAVTQLSTQTQKYVISKTEQENTEKGEQPIWALSSDGLRLEIDISIWYRIDPTLAPQLFRDVGAGYMNKVIKPAIRTSVRECAKNFEATVAFSSGRDILQEEIQVKTQEMVYNIPGCEGVIIERVNIQNINPPAQVITAIEAKLAAQQEAEAMVYKLQKTYQEAEQRRIQAEGIRDAQEIINASLTPQYLEWKYIESLELLVQSPNAKIVILPFDQDLIPMLNLE